MPFALLDDLHPEGLALGMLTCALVTLAIIVMFRIIDMFRRRR
jgi:hypothetical protein